jgi:hypothetical protein
MGGWPLAIWGMKKGYDSLSHIEIQANHHNNK